jgi:hypothetical protein
MATKNFAANLKIGATMGSSVGRVFGGIKTKIKDQESSLKKLRAAFKDASKGTGEYVGKLDQLQREIAQTEQGLLKLRAASKIDFGKSFKGIGGAFKGDMKRAGVVGGVLSAAGLGIAKDMLDTTAAFEKQLAILKTLEGSEEKAKQAFAWIQDFAQKTPYELSQVTEAFARLKGAGIDPIRGDALRILGDSAAGMGKEVMQLVEALADAQMGQNERLMELMITGRKVGDQIEYAYTDKAGKDQVKRVSATNKAQIRSTLLAIWNSKYKGAMDEQSKTWNGMISNMKDAWARFAYDVMQSGPFEGLKAQLGDFLKRLEVWSKDGTMKRWAEDTGKWLVKAGTQIGDIAIGFWKALDATQKFVGGWKNLGLILLAANFAPTILAIGQMAKGMWVLAAATWAALGPIGLLSVAIAAIGLVLFSIIDQGGPLDLLGKMFPETMAKIRATVRSTFEAIERAIDGAIAKMNTFIDKFEWMRKIRRGIVDFFSFDTVSPAPKYDLPQSFYGVPPKGGPSPLVLPPKEAPPATKEDLLEFLKPQSSNNTFNINVNAPGANGDDIAERIRRTFERKPLFDSDGALVPG